MVTSEVLREDTGISNLKRLVGGDLKAGEISIDPGSDPDEDSARESSIIFGKTDRMDALRAYLDMDVAGFGIMMRRVSPPDLHKSDIDAIRLDCELQERARSKRAI